MTPETNIILYTKIIFDKNQNTKILKKFMINHLPENLRIFPAPISTGYEIALGCLRTGTMEVLETQFSGLSPQLSFPTSPT